MSGTPPMSASRPVASTACAVSSTSGDTACDTLLPSESMELVRSLARDVRATLAGELGEQSPWELCDEAFAFVATLRDALATRQDDEARRRLPVCQPGCTACCVLHPVFVTPLELFRIARHLRATLSEAALASLLDEVRALAPVVAPMGVRERGIARIPCPLLDRETLLCRAYEVRPLLCRSYNSCDRAACDRAFEEGDALTPPPASAPHASAPRHVFVGLLLGAEAHGLVALPHELVNALVVALGDASAEARWLLGEDVLAPAATALSREHGPGFRAFVERERAAVR